MAPDGHYEMIGVPEAIAAALIKGQPDDILHGKHPMQLDYPTMAYAIPMKTVREFLAAYGFGFVVGA
jgi:hypothetical protein